MVLAASYRELQGIADEIRVDYKTVLSHRGYLIKRGCGPSQRAGQGRNSWVRTQKGG